MKSWNNDEQEKVNSLLLRINSLKSSFKRLNERRVQVQMMRFNYHFILLKWRINLKWLVKNLLKNQLNFTIEILRLLLFLCKIRTNLCSWKANRDENKNWCDFKLKFNSKSNKNFQNQLLKITWSQKSHPWTTFELTFNMRIL